MLGKLLGWVWLIFGIWYLVRPEALRNKFQKKSLKKIKKILFGITLVLGIWMILAGFRTEGLFSKLLVIFGVVALFKGVFFLKAKAADRILGWYAKQPVLFFRLSAVFYVLAGIAIIRFA